MNRREISNHIPYDWWPQRNLAYIQDHQSLAKRQLITLACNLFISTDYTIHKFVFLSQTKLINFKFTVCGNKKIK